MSDELLWKARANAAKHDLELMHRTVGRLVFLAGAMMSNADVLSDFARYSIPDMTADELNGVSLRYIAARNAFEHAVHDLPEPT